MSFFKKIISVFIIQFFITTNLCYGLGISHNKQKLDASLILAQIVKDFNEKNVAKKLHQLPPELIIEILSYLNTKDIDKVSKAYEYFKKIFTNSNNELWKNLNLTHYKKYMPKHFKSTNWKKIYEICKRTEEIENEKLGLFSKIWGGIKRWKFSITSQKKTEEIENEKLSLLSKIWGGIKSWKFSITLCFLIVSNLFFDIENVSDNIKKVSDVAIDYAKKTFSVGAFADVVSYYVFMISIGLLVYFSTILIYETMKEVAGKIGNPCRYSYKKECLELLESKHISAKKWQIVYEKLKERNNDFIKINSNIYNFNLLDNFPHNLSPTLVARRKEQISDYMAKNLGKYLLRKLLDINNGYSKELLKFVYNEIFNSDFKINEKYTVIVIANMDLGEGMEESHISSYRTKLSTVKMIEKIRSKAINIIFDLLAKDDICLNRKNDILETALSKNIKIENKNFSFFYHFKEDVYKIISQNNYNIDHQQDKEDLIKKILEKLKEQVIETNLYDYIEFDEVVMCNRSIREVVATLIECNKSV